MSKKPKGPTAPIDPFKIFRQAQAFELASFRLSRAFKAGDDAMRAPYITTSAFSLELFLKCLLTIRRKTDFGHIHNLHILYGKLDDEDAKRIIELYEENVASHPVMQNIFKAEKLNLVPTLKWGITDVLDRIKLAFPDWRYSHELVENKMVYAGAQPISDAVKSMILTIKPAWPKEREPNPVQSTFRLR